MAGQAVTHGISSVYPGCMVAPATRIHAQRGYVARARGYGATRYQNARGRFIINRTRCAYAPTWRTMHGRMRTRGFIVRPLGSARINDWML